jgi:uncharacterized tellurite resistance protein B-like protein
MILDRLKGLLGTNSNSPRGPRSPQERLRIAACALLLEMALTDSDFNEGESHLISDLLQRNFEISAEAATELMEISRRERESSPDLYQFTREINENFTIEEKLDFVESLWRIVYADGVLDRYEDALMRQLTTLLRLSPREVIDLKLRVLDEVRSAG